MQINEAKIFNFGKLQNRTFQFAPGINVIYGENESGKSTLTAFLTGMLFGMEKGRGRAAANLYSRYEPWHAPSYYSGALRFSVDGKPFYLERNFYHREKSEQLFNEADGEKMSVAYGDLAMLIGGIRRETFEQTCLIPQSGAATGGALAAILAEYLTDAFGSGDGSVQVVKAVTALKTREKELKAELKKEKENREAVISASRTEEKLLEQDVKAQKQEVEKAETAMIMLAEPETLQQNIYPDRAHKISVAGAAKWLVLLLFVGNLILYQLHPYQPWIFYGIELMLVLAGAAEFLGGQIKKQRRTGEKAAETSEENPAVRIAREMLKNARESLREKEVRLFNLRQQIQEAQKPGAKERELNENICALELAAKEIERLAEDIYADVEDELNAEVSRWVSVFTAGHYDSVRVDGNGKLWIRTEGKEVPPDALSRGALEQIYLALRVSVGRIATREESMPFFFDEAFAMYDDRRLVETLKALSKMNGQIFLFTCQKREEEILDALGIPYHKVYV